MNDSTPDKNLSAPPRLSKAAADVSWQFMLYKEGPSEEKHQRAKSDAERLCNALESAREVFQCDAPAAALRDELVGQAVKRRLIEHRREVEPVVVHLVTLLPNIQRALGSDKLSADQIQFLQTEFAALSLLLQDRGL